jgi:predicted Zn-dependent peptidase
VIEENQMYVFVRGNVSHDQVLKAAEAALPRSTAKRPLPVIEVRENPGEQREMTVDGGAGHSILFLGCHVGINRRYEEWVALEAALYLLGGYPDSLLFKRLRDEHGLAYSVHARGNSLKGLALFSIATQKKHWHKAKELVLQEIKRVQTGEVPAEDVRAAVDSLITEHARVQDNEAQHVMTYFNGILAGGVRPLARRVELLRHLQPEDVAQAAARIRPELIYYFKGDN